MDYSKLISEFSHEIRNPLTLINSSLQLLENDCPAVLDSPLWPQIRQDMQDVLRLLQDMSSLNKSSRITRIPVSISDLLTGIESSFRPMMEQRNMHFIVTIDDALRGTMINADGPKLKEAVTNLLLNAVDAVSESTCGGKIYLLASQADSLLTIHVKDNGPGIPSEYLDTLFDPFVTHKAHGTGLGLGIARNIVTQHGGSLLLDTCTSLPETYTDFCLQLPI